MALLPINTGSAPGAGDGDRLHDAFTKVNTNDQYLEAQIETRAPAAHTHDARYYTRGEVDNLLLDPPAAHTHTISDVTNLQNALDGKAATSHTHTIANVTGLQGALDGKAATSHNHAAGDITSGTLSVARGGTGAGSFTSGNYLRGNGTSALQARTPVQVLSDIGAAAASHSHAISDVTSLQGALDAKASTIAGAGARVVTFTDGAQDAGGTPLASTATANTVALRGTGGTLAVGAPTGDTHAATKKYVDDHLANSGGGDMLKSVYDSLDNGTVNAARSAPWSGVTDKPSTFPPSAHSHTISDVTNLQGALDGKAATSHTHTIANVTGLQGALDGKAATSHNHAAGDITSGTLSVARGGTGASTLTSGSYLRGNGTSAVQLRTPVQVLSDIGAAAASHSHAISDVTGLQGALDGKANSSHTHSIAQVTGLQAALLDPFYVNPQQDGAVDIAVPAGGFTLDLSNVTVRGTGSVAYERSTNGTTFSTVSGSTAFSAGDVFRINVTGYDPDDYLTLTIPRTA